MISNISRYERPDSLAEALRLLKEGQGRAVPLAGGSALLGTPPREVETVVDLAQLKLDWILGREDGGLTLGAMASLSALMASDEVRAYGGGALLDALRLSAGSLVRNRATLGGTLIARAGTSDVVALLLALDARVRLYGETEQETDLADFYRRRAYHLQPGALLKEILLAPLPAGCGVVLQRIARTPMDQPILTVGACVLWEEGQLQRAQLAVTALGGGEGPLRLNTLEHALQQLDGEEALEGALASAAEGVSFKDDHLASAAYRRAMLPILLRRALLATR